MTYRLHVSVGQCSDKGRKDVNQDFHGVYIPNEPQLSTKGVAIALADGISSSDVSQIASETSVAGFLEDYFCTPEAWSVRKSAQRVLMATNSWLYAQTRQSQYRFDKDRGYVCTLSAMVIKSTTAYLFHVGDARIYRRQGDALEQLTTDHRVWVSQDQSYLGRALGIDSHVEIDHRALPVEKGDLCFLMTDGVYEHVGADVALRAVEDNAADLDGAARAIVREAYERGSRDNLTVQVVRVDALPAHDADEIARKVTELRLPPLLKAGDDLDGYTILREIHASSRSHVYLATQGDTGAQVVIKTPSIDLQGDAAYLERLLMEEWIARRLHDTHVVKPCPQDRKRTHVYTAMAYVDGQTLSQWMIDHPSPDLETVRTIVEQIAKGLRAFHRLEMLHQDLRPGNIMIDKAGTVTIIDLGSTRVAGIMEMTGDREALLGTAPYTAPEYFLGEGGTPRSELFSLGVIAYQMLTGELPYGTQVAKSRTRAAQNKLVYQPIFDGNRDVPVWIDDVMKKALHPNPDKRYQELSEFTFELRHPSQAFVSKARPPLMERNPVLFWKSLSLVLAIVVLVLVIQPRL